jgi:hypothetical protein
MATQDYTAYWRSRVPSLVEGILDEHGRSRNIVIQFLFKNKKTGVVRLQGSWNIDPSDDQPSIDRRAGDLLRQVGTFDPDEIDLQIQSDDK